MIRWRVPADKERIKRVYAMKFYGKEGIYRRVEKMKHVRGYKYGTIHFWTVYSALLAIHGNLLL